jgi:signal transduction histidine kinase
MTSSDLDEAEKLSKESTPGQSSDPEDCYIERRNEFINRLAHDLKTPLFGSREVLQLILSGACGKVEPEVEHLILLLKQTNEDLLQMMQRLLDVYRYEAGCAVLKRSTCDWAALIQQLVSQLQTSAEANEISLSYSCTSENLMLALDQASMQRAVANLLRNLIKHMRTGGHLDVRLSKDNAAAVLRVNVKGLGMSRSEIDGIFLLSQQRTASKSYSPMTGLELHLCRQIIHAHGGTISNAGNDANEFTITISLPA